MNAFSIPETNTTKPVSFCADAMDDELNVIEVLVSMLGDEISRLCGNDDSDRILLRQERCLALQSAIEDKLAAFRGDLGINYEALNTAALVRRAAA